MGAVSAIAEAGVQSPSENATVWQIGRADDSSGEFADYPASPGAQALTAPADWKTRSDWSAVPKGLRGNRNSALDVQYTLPSVPKYGVMFSVKLINAPKSGAQMAVFSNGEMAGLLQFWGTAGTSSPYRWMRTYRLYIPKEMLSAGDNKLRFETVRPMFSDSRVDSAVWFEWDYLKLDTLAAPAREPIHGAVAYLGTTLKHSGHDFNVNDDTVRLAGVVLPWLGIAYSGNTVRADFWVDVLSQQPRRLEYLEKLRDLNMTVCADNVSGIPIHKTPAGDVPDSTTGIDSFFNQFGSLIQYYELGNEPCMFGGSYAEYLSTAHYIDQIKPATVKLAAPGWAYGGGKGTPVNWDADVNRRRQVEAYCDALNGHSYGYSYTDDRGGSFVENLKSLRGVEDGWPEECITTETGTNNWHSEDNSTHFPSTEPKIQAFDRILRAHLAVVTRTMQHALIFDDYGMFQEMKDLSDPTLLTAYPGPDGGDTRLKTYRRLALAYATHGAPLAYVCLNGDAITDKKVYFRAVDTMALPAQAGSGAVSDKILLSFVNFENAPESIAVRVTMPVAGEYHGDRFGAGDNYPAAHSAVSLTAKPSLDLTVDLGPGESVQYILQTATPRAPYAPDGLVATPADGAIAVTWPACSKADSYQVSRSSTEGGPFQKMGLPNAATAYVDKTVVPGKRFWYCVTAYNVAGSSESAAISAVAGTPLPVGRVTAVPGDGAATLSWPQSTTATTYSVFRSQSRYGAYTVVAPGLATPEYTDHDVQNGTTYYYAISAVNKYGESAASNADVTPEAPPAPPTGLSAIAGSSCVALNWTASPSAESYIIQRATKAGGPYDVVASDVAETEYIDTSAPNGEVGYYVVAAKAVAVAGPSSTDVGCAAESEPLADPWRDADIGSVGTPGAAAQSAKAGTITVRGAGSDIYGNGDTIHFVYQPLHGDGAITARVTHLDDTSPFATAAVMVRESLAPGSVMASMGMTIGHGGGFPHRDVTDGPCDFSGGAAHRWLRIERRGQSVLGYVSDDGIAWKQFGQATISMKPDVFVGLAVCSHVSRLNRVLFGNISVSPAAAQ